MSNETNNAAREIKELRAKLRAVRAEMKASGVKRLSMMNGGHSPLSMRLNEECFRLETLIQRAKQGN